MDRLVVSCIPKQLFKLDDKLSWLQEKIKKLKPDIFVTPQEFFGGAYIMPGKKFFSEAELLPTLSFLSGKYKCSLVVGLVEQIGGKNYEVIWFINEKGELQGKIKKFALPKYDHVLSKGYGNIVPETDMTKRFQTFVLSGMVVAAMFCWEVYSDILWTGLGLLKPDVVFSLIKFGVNSWPKVIKNENTGQMEIVDFGYASWAEDGNWIGRLHMANAYQVKCPIVCSTNSWNLKPRSMPLCGTISTIDGQADHTLWVPKQEDKSKEIPEVIREDKINPDRVQLALKNKFLYRDIVGEFPPFSLAKYTMMLKINRIEDRILSGKEEQRLVGTPVSPGNVPNSWNKSRSKKKITSLKMDKMI